MRKLGQLILVMGVILFLGGLTGVYFTAGDQSEYNHVYMINAEQVSDTSDIDKSNAVPYTTLPDSIQDKLQSSFTRNDGFTGNDPIRFETKEKLDSDISGFQLVTIDGVYLLVNINHSGIVPTSAPMAVPGAFIILGIIFILVMVISQLQDGIWTNTSK